MHVMAGVVAVVPARNEQRDLPRCLAALDDARDELLSAAGAPWVRIIVVLDRCTDATASVAAQWPGVETLVSHHGKVGAARAAGARYGLGTAGADPSRLWLACTDADSAVPRDWFVTHLDFASQGWELVLGTVRPDVGDLESRLEQRWLSEHDLFDGHPHVHGANMGIRADAYLRAGGFDSVAAHEDLLLAGRIRDSGALTVATARSPVLTSGRLTGRAPSGMASYLRNLAAEEVESVPQA